MQLSYYLFDESINKIQNIWKDGAKSPPDGYKKIRLKTEFRPWADAYLCENKPSIPAWVEFVGPCCVTGALVGVENISNSLVLLLKVKNRVFAICFGYGHTAIAQDLLEADFGLWVTANSLRKDGVRAIQARNIDPTTISRHLVVNHDSEMFIFDVDFLLNILTSLEGTPADPTLGMRIRGRDACYLTSKISIEKLKEKCAELLKAFKLKRKDDAFQMLRDVRHVKNKPRQKELDDALEQSLQQGVDTSIGLVLPDIGAYEKITHYDFGSSSKRTKLDDLSIAEVIDWIGKHARSNAHLLRLTFESYDLDDNLIKRFSLKQALVFQTIYKGDTYVHTLGRWYRIAADFVDRVNSDIGKIDSIPKGTWLPDIDQTNKESEGDYNERVQHTQKGWALLDKKNVRIVGASQIEVADLFTPAKQFVHVKRHTRSATLSHLFAQGTVSARLFKDYPEYRKKMKAKLPSKLKPLVDPKSSNVSGFSVVYAISAPPSKNLPGDLPFFSKVNMLQHARELDRMGYKVEFYHIHEK